MSRYSLFTFILSILCCVSCEPDKPLSKVKLPDQAASLKVQFKRMDQDLFAANFNEPQVASQELYQKYGNFFCRFVESDLRLAACKSDSVGRLLKPFVTNADISKTHKAIEEIYTPEVMQDLQEELTAAMRKWNYYFPQKPVPAVVFYQSAWNNNIHPTDSVLGISLDCYLGYNHAITKMLDRELFPNYQKRNMEQRFLVADAVKGWVAYQFKDYYKPKDLLSEMVFYGKLMYTTEALIPEAEDSILMSWGSKEVQWVDKNEWNIWKTIANEKTLFQQQPFEINKWFSDGPFTGARGIPQDSPPQLGIWFGWNMVRQYMANNPMQTLSDLMTQVDDQTILRSYKPKRK